MPVNHEQADHDLLITLNERVSNLIEKLDTVIGTNKTLAGDHEDRIRWLEHRGWMLTGGVLVISTVISWGIAILYH